MHNPFFKKNNLIITNILTEFRVFSIREAHLLPCIPGKSHWMFSSQKVFEGYHSSMLPFFSHPSCLQFYQNPPLSGIVVESACYSLRYCHVHMNSMNDNSKSLYVFRHGTRPSPFLRNPKIIYGY